MEKIKIITEIGNLKVKLRESDYIAIKYVEGMLSIEQYQPIKEQRQKWRDEINQLEKQIEELNQDL